MAEDTLDTFVAPRYRKQRATPSSKETKARVNEAAKFAADMVIPQTPMDAGLMLIPGGKIARKAGAALIALDASDAEAGPLTKLLKAFHGARKPIDGIFNVEKASESSIMGKGLNVSTDPSYPSKWSMRPGSEAPTVYETAIPVDKYIQLDATYPPEAFGVLRKMRGRNPLPEGQVTGEQVYQTLRGIPQTLIPDTVLKSGYKGIEYPAQDGGRWFSIYDTEGVKDRLGKKFAEGGEVRMGKGGALSKLVKRVSGEDAAAKAIGTAAESAGMKAPVTANKPLTDLQDFYTSLSDRIRQGAAETQIMIDSMPFKFDKGQRVFTEDSAKKNRAPYEILERTRYGNKVMRADHPTLGANMGQTIRDPETGKAMRTPYEPGYRVRGEIGEMILPESAIKGNVDFARGGSVSVYDPDQIDEIVNSIDEPQGYAEGGEVRMGKGGVVKAALEEARDQILKLRALKDEGKHWLEDNKELPRF